MKYNVHIIIPVDFIPVDIAVDAKNEKQAQKKAWDLLRSRAKSDVWLEPWVYKGKSMHELELEKEGR